MPKSKETYTEIDDIREDLNSLKNNVIALTNHIKKDGAAQTEDFKGYAAAQLHQMKANGELQMKHLEKNVKAHPGRSLMIAFASGLVASMLLGRR